jgi:hypothetical protein
MAGILGGAKPNTLTYWQFSGVDQYGDPSFSAPEERAVRWQDSNEFFYGPDGQGRQSQSVIYDDVNSYTPGDYVYRGSSAESDPRNVTGAKPIQSVKESPSVGGDEVLRKVML